MLRCHVPPQVSIGAKEPNRSHDIKGTNYYQGHGQGEAFASVGQVFIQPTGNREAGRRPRHTRAQATPQAKAKAKANSKAKRLLTQGLLSTSIAQYLVVVQCSVGRRERETKRGDLPSIHRDSYCHTTVRLLFKTCCCDLPRAVT